MTIFEGKNLLEWLTKHRHSQSNGVFYRAKAPISAAKWPFYRQKTRKSAQKRPIVDFFKKNNK